jgi:hypothetical protein
MVLPENAVRPFATYFLQQKKHTFAHDLSAAGKMAAKWEKKGSSFIRPKPMREYVEARRVVLRMLAKIEDLGGHVFYYGREKLVGIQENLNPIGLYTTCFAHALRRLDRYCEERNSNFVVVVDEHSARKELLECASKTMFGRQPCRHLSSPPFEAESYLNQNVQAADWIATLVGRLTAFEVAPQEYADYGYIHTIFGERIHKLKRNSALEKRPSRPTEKHSSGPFASLASLREAMTKRA